MRLRALIPALLALAVIPAAKADVILGGQNWTFGGVDNLTLSAVVPGGNQPQNIQCVICGANQPQQAATFGYTDFKNQGSTATIQEFSTNVSGGGTPGENVIGIPYDGSFLRAYLAANGGGSLQFSIGIDVNDNNTPQSLNSFFLLNFTTNTVLAAYTGGPTPLPNQNNGTGFPDFTLTGFDLTIGGDIHAGDQLIFFARMSDLSDGPDSFFLVPTQVAVPGPLAGAGLPGLIAACGGLWFMQRRRRSRLA